MNKKNATSEKRSEIIQKHLEKMPSLSTTVTKVLTVCNSPSTSANDLNKVIALDPVLAGNVLQLINSVYYAMREPVTSLTKAIIMLGLNTIKNLALSTAILGGIDEKNFENAKLMDMFWTHSIFTGAAAKAIARKTKVLKANQEEYFVAGLLHDIGKIPMIRCFPKDYMKVISFSYEKNIPVNKVEKKGFGIDHTQTGKMIAEKWNLLGFLYETICYHHSPDSADEDNLKVVNMVALADYHARTLDDDQAENSVPDDPILKYLLEKNNVRYTTLIDLRQEILAEIENAKVFLKVTQKGQEMKIKFWGVRGSIPCPGLNTVKYGGNTSCIEIRFGDPERQIILDAGSGIRDLGNYMMTHDLPKGPISTNLFLTHTHWDHIMGFPFFTPIYIPGTKLNVYGPVSFHNDTLKEIVGGQMTYRYFPVNQVELASDIEYIELREGPVDFKDNSLKITTKYTNHPVLCLGYRFEYNGRILCTAYDSEPFRNLFYTDPKDPAYDEMMAEEGEKTVREENAKLEAFFQGADLLIQDAQYSEKEYQSSRIGWGHTSMESAIESSQRAGVKRLALFHHEPLNSDDIIDDHVKHLKLDKPVGDMDVFFAREGMEIEI